MDTFRVRKASELIDTLLSPEAAKKADSWARFFGFWSKATGESLAAHSRPVDLRNGIVYVEASHAGWIQLLQMEQDRILDSMKKSFPDLGIRGIAFRLARDPSIPGTLRDAGPARVAADGAPEPVAEEPALADASRASVAQTLEAINDDSFRSILRSLAKTLDTAKKDGTDS